MDDGELASDEADICRGLTDELMEPQNIATRALPKLFHYTDADALLAMLKGRTVRATHTDYVNDASEVIHGTSLIREVLSTIEKQDAGAQSMLREVQRRFSQSMANDIYVFCLTLSGDDLSQWRSYGRDGYGYVVGFNFFNSTLRTRRPVGDLMMRKVIYDDDEKRQRITESVDRFAELFDTTHYPNLKAERAKIIVNARASALIKHLATLRAIFKERML